MITRKFEQQWEQSTSQINNMTEEDVLFDFNEYLTNMRFALKYIKDKHHDDFNAKTKKNIDDLYSILLKRIEQFNTICLEKDQNGEFKSLCFSYENVKTSIYEKDGNHIRLKDDVFSALKKIAQSVFEIEEQVSKYVEAEWISALTDVKDYSSDSQYMLLAHADYKCYPQDDTPEELKKYNSQQQGLCFSLITDKKTRIFDQSTNYYNFYSHKNGLVGIIAKPKKDSMVSMSSTDMLSTEFIDGKCTLLRHFNHSKVNRCFVNGNSEIYSKGTKIIMPSNMFDLDVDTINEVILGANKIDVQAVFYVKTPNGQIPARFEEYKKEQEKLCGHKLQTIQLFPRNRLKQYNLDEIMYNM